MQALEHFAQLGYPCPPHHNPAEFVADLVSPESNLEGKAGEAQVSGRWVTQASASHRHAAKTLSKSFSSRTQPLLCCFCTLSWPLHML
eukprot:1145381-Pelagomonas_calceolata.AAC.4